MSRKKKDAASGREPTQPGWIPFALFLLALSLRLLFWQATPDRSWAYSAAYQGDAMVWLDYAAALKSDLPFAQNLPLRPPGNAYLVALLWDGTPSGFFALKLFWCLLGALAVPLFFRALRDAFSYPVALAAGLVLAASSPLLMFATSINNEAPYLLLVAILFASWRGVCSSPSIPRLLSWGFVNALACLFRAEHLLFFLLGTAGLLALSWRHDRIGTTWKVIGRRFAWVAAAAFVCLLPWHLEAWAACRDFNRLEPQVPPATAQAQAAIESQLAFLSWEDGARELGDRLPAFSRRTMKTFVAATVAMRGGTRVTANDFAILDQAFGWRPEPISEHPLLALYGGLNFYLANPGDGEGGFSRAALEAPPPLEGGIGRYPAMLVGGLPPNDLALSYPPHLAAVNHGYALGLAWLRDHLGAVPGLLFAKARIFWSGAAPGLGGFNAPLGLSGERRRVDLTVAQGPLASAWRLLILAFFLLGLWSCRRRVEALPFALLFLNQAVASLAFFGYARLGALALPAVAAFVACGVAALPWPARFTAAPRILRGALVVGALLLLSEAIRTAHGEVPYLDGRSTAQGDPYNPDLHENRQLEMR